MKVWHGVVTGVAAYVFFIVAGAPAARVLPWLQPALSAVQLAGVEGTVWNGSAAIVNAAPVQLQQVNWRLRPWAAVLGRLEFAVDARLRGRSLQGRVGRGLFGRPYLSQVQGSVTAADALNWAKINQVGIDGVLSFDIADVQWSDAPWPAIGGSLSWSPATVTRPVELALGKVQLDTRIEDGITRGKLDASGGGLLVQGNLELQPAGNYRLDAQIQQQGDVAPEVAQFLATFATYKDGTYLLEWSDTI
ncbi:MAG: type II secretion system protein N [Thiogranum sp.]|nr:type II secretion system protein N [Thiogranum sp.]